MLVFPRGGLKMKARTKGAKDKKLRKKRVGYTETKGGFLQVHMTEKAFKRFVAGYHF
jgi:hypothetical protein